MHCVFIFCSCTTHLRFKSTHSYKTQIHPCNSSLVDEQAVEITKVSSSACPAGHLKAFFFPRARTHMLPFLIVAVCVRPIYSLFFTYAISSNWATFPRISLFFLSTPSRYHFSRRQHRQLRNILIPSGANLNEHIHEHTSSSSSSLAAAAAGSWNLIRACEWSHKTLLILLQLDWRFVVCSLPPLLDFMAI